MAEMLLTNQLRWHRRMAEGKDSKGKVRTYKRHVLQQLWVSPFSDKRKDRSWRDVPTEGEWNIPGKEAKE